MRRFLGISASMLLWVVSSATGQSPRRDSIATYLPTWQRTEDLNDYVSPKHTSHASSPDGLRDLSPTRKLISLHLFRLPPDSATHRMDERIDTNTSHVRPVLAAPKTPVRGSPINKPSRAGQPVIRIRRQ